MTVKLMPPAAAPLNKQQEERQMKDKTSNAITNIIMRLFNAADGVSPLDNYFRAVVRKRFPGATEDMIRAGWSRAAERFEAENNAGQVFFFDLQEVALETGMVLRPE